MVDTFLGHWVPGGAGALNFLWGKESPTGKFYVKWVKWNYEMCTEKMLLTGECLPFLDDGGILFTMGYAITLLIFLPMALMDLKVSG